MNTGATIWAIAGGKIPMASSGPEPEFTSRDWLSIVNTCQTEAEIDITIFHSDKRPTGPFKIKIAAERCRKIRINDLVDPEPIFLDEAYAMVIQSNMPIVIQFSRMHTAQTSLALMSAIAAPCEC